MRNTIWLKDSNIKSFLKNDKYGNLDKAVVDILEDRQLSLNDDFDFDPFTFYDMEKAVDRILEAIKKNQKISIYGDYDVDGITSVSLLYLAFLEMGANVDYYIPLRDDGYGLNNEAILNLKENSTDLVISVDCGINSINEIDYANSLNLDFIITDHHEITGTLPNALAIINPKRDENIYEFKYLAGVGTAFMLCYAIYKKLNKLECLNKYLDIVAIGTVADIVPLISDNRKFVRKGLKQLNQTKWVGLKLLMRKLFPDDYETRTYKAQDIGYLIAPIFNAAGRLEDAKNAVKLFLEEDSFKCLEIIEELLKNNFDRKEIQKNIYEASIMEIEKKELYNKNLILVANKKFHHGVIGIVASKVLEKYYKPTIIMEIKENEGIATASCRSIEGLNIVECLNSVSDILLKYGGHSGAAGFTISIEKIPEFYERVEDYIANHFHTDTFKKRIRITNILEPYKVSYNFLKDLEILEPFGASNHTPIFAFKNCTYSNLRFTKNSSEHIFLDIKKDNFYFKNCMFFGGGDYYDTIVKSKKIDIAFKLKLEIFKDRYMYKIYIEDIKNSDENKDFEDEISKLGKDVIFPIETVVYTRRTDVDENIHFQFTDYGVDVIKDRTIVSSLDSNLSELLLELKKNFNYNFSVELKNKFLKEENINLHLKIDKDKSFFSYAIKDNQLFLDIKKHLIGNFSYNSIQKNILSSIFKNKERTIGIIEKGRGINTIIETINLFFKEKGKTISLNNFEKEADFYIFYNYPNVENLSFSSKNILILSEKELEIENFKKIIDDYSLPKNLKIIDYDKVIDNPNIYHYFLSENKKLELLDKLKNGEKILATQDIKIHF